MSKLILVACLFMGSAVFASDSGYDLKVELSMNGKKPTQYQIIVKKGLKASIESQTPNDGNFIEVIANEGSIQNHKGILMDFLVGSIDQNGKRTVVSTLQVLANENEKAQITVGNENGKEGLTLSVIATRKNL